MRSYCKSSTSIGLAAILLGLTASDAQALVVNSPADVDLESLPYISPQVPKNERNDKACTLVEAIALSNWKNNGGSASTQPTFDCGAAAVGKNQITFLASYIPLKKRAFAQAAFEIASDIELVGPVEIDARATGRIFRLGGSKSKLSISKTTLTNGRVEGGGAAVLVDNPLAQFTATDSRFLLNEALAKSGTADGGAIFNTAVITKDPAGAVSTGVQLFNSLFQNNSGSRGGAYFGPPMFVVGSTFANNAATHAGGALYVSGGQSRTQDIHLCQFAENVVYHPYEGILDEGGRGGAIFSGSPLLVTYSDFSSNRIATDIYQMMVNGIEVDSDTAPSIGGAIYLGTAADAGSVIAQSTFRFNKSGRFNGSSGALRLERTATIVGTGFYQNTAATEYAIGSKAGNLSVEDKVMIANSTFVENGLTGEFFGGTLPQDIDGAGTIVTSGAAVIDMRNTYVFQNTTAGAALHTRNGTPGKIVMYNTAVGVQQGTLGQTCDGNIVDGGGNVQSEDEFKPGSCPATIPVAMDSTAFDDSQSFSFPGPIGYYKTSMPVKVGYPGAGVYSQMKGKGVPSICLGTPVNNMSQREEPRSGCDIGPAILK